MSAASLKFQCPICNAIIKAPAAASGTKVQCPRCGQRLQAPTLPKNKTVLAPLVEREDPIPTAPFAPPLPRASWKRQAILAGTAMLFLAMVLTGAGLATRDKGKASDVVPVADAAKKADLLLPPEVAKNDDAGEEAAPTLKDNNDNKTTPAGTIWTLGTVISPKADPATEKFGDVWAFNVDNSPFASRYGNFHRHPWWNRPMNEEKIAMISDEIVLMHKANGRANAKKYKLKLNSDGTMAKIDVPPGEPETLTDRTLSGNNHFDFNWYTFFSTGAKYDADMSAKKARNVLVRTLDHFEDVHRAPNAFDMLLESRSSVRTPPPLPNAKMGAPLAPP